MCRKLFLLISLVLLLGLAVPASADLIASFEPGETSLSLTPGGDDPNLTLTMVTAASVGLTAPDGDYILKMVAANETDGKFEYNMGGISFDLAGKTTVQYDLYFTNSLPGTLGLWDLDGLFGWYEVPSEQLPDATGQWFTVSIDVTSRQETGLTEIGAVVFENMDPNNLAITAYMDNLIIFGPNEAFNPSPVSGSPSVDPNADLTWEAGEYAALHKVYFGTTNPPDYNCDKALGDTTFDPGIMDYNTTYYWRIDEVNDSGVPEWPGDVWSFTVALPPALVLMASYEPSEVDELTVTEGEPGLTLSWPVLGGSGGVPTATEGSYVLKWDIVNETDGKVEIAHYWATKAFCLDGYDYILCDVWIDTAAILPMTVCGIYDDLFGGWHQGDPTPDTSGEWITVEYDVSICDQTIKHIWALLFEGMQAPTTGVIYTDNLRLFRSAGLESSWPSPENYAIAVDPNRVIKWAAGNDANEHDVYFGTDYNDVNDANTSDATGIYRVRQQDTNDPNYDPPETLDFDTTYYWRIDEVLADDTVTKGDVWSFTMCAADYTVTPLLSFEPEERDNYRCTSGEGIINDSVEGNTVNPTGWPYGDVPPATDGNYVLGFKWQNQTDYKVEYRTEFLDGYTFDLLGQDEMLFDVYFATDSPVPLASGCWDDVSFDPPFLGGSNLPRETGQWYTVVMDVSEHEETNLDNILATLFENMINGIPDNSAGILFVDNFRLRRAVSEFAWNPNPEDGETGVDPDVIVTWKPGKAVQPTNGHEVYFGTDYEEVNDANSTSHLNVDYAVRDVNNYDPTGTLDLDTTYYWRVDEVNTAEEPNSPWKGAVWNFTTRNYLTVEDFESYTDTGVEPYQPGDLLYVWEDKIGTGYEYAHLIKEEFEPDNTHESAQSMQFDYYTKVDPYYSAVRRTYGTPQNWSPSNNSVKALTLWFRGEAGNDAEQMYVELEDAATKSAKVIHPDPDLQNEQWQEWNIDLQAFVTANDVNLANIKKLTIGFGDGESPGAKTSKVYFDDIRLYIPRCFSEYAPGDFTGECIVDLNDLDIMTAEWLASDYTLPTQEPCDANLEAYYMLDDGSGTTATDSSNNSRNGMLTGTNDPAWVDGKIGPNSLSFISAETDCNAVYCGTFNPSETTGELTVSAWAYWDGGGFKWQSILAKRETWLPTPDMMWQLAIADGLIEFVCPPASWALAEVMPMPVEEWIHLAVTFDGTNATFYANGIAKKSGPFTLGTGTTASVMIGACKQDGSVAESFNGDIDDVRIYNYALSHAEVAYLAAEGALNLYIPLPDSAAAVDIHVDGKVNFKDYAVLAEDWLTKILWP